MLSCRWKDLYFVWLKYLLMISVENRFWLKTLKDLPPGCHATISWKPWVSESSSMPCNLSGNEITSDPALIWAGMSWDDWSKWSVISKKQEVSTSVDRWIYEPTASDFVKETWAKSPKNCVFFSSVHYPTHRYERTNSKNTTKHNNLPSVVNYE